jgi:diaminohydroxyphosphoribosylaminopyrimidine deaminase/5-amino-6-(5-phosphoribosylamino)uracil reductase
MTNAAELMQRAVANAARVRHSTSPNPWVGAVAVRADGEVFDGATEPPGGRHAERVALDAAGDARGASVYTTLEPCSHQGRTGPCTEALIDAGVSRVFVGIEDPDPLVAGTGIDRLRDEGIDVVVGVCAEAVERQLTPYLHHRRTGRPYVVAKLAATLDGRTAAPDGTSQWITGPQARADGHRIRAESDAVLVGAGTVRADDPALTVREWTAPHGTPPATNPRRIVLGSAAAGALIHPCTEWSGSIEELLTNLGSDDVVQLMVEGGAGVLGDFQRAGLIDEYVVYLAPSLFGGDDARGLFAGPGAPTIADVQRGQIVAVTQVGTDVRITLKPGAGDPRAG